MLRSAGLASEADVEKFFIDQKSPISLAALGAVVFYPESLDGDKIRRDTTITYKIRLRAEQYNGTYKSGAGGGDGWQTSRMHDITMVGPRGDMYGGRSPGLNKCLSRLIVTRKPIAGLRKDYVRQ